MIRDRFYPGNEAVRLSRRQLDQLGMRIALKLGLGDPELWEWAGDDIEGPGGEVMVAIKSGGIAVFVEIVQHDFRPVVVGYLEPIDEHRAMRLAKKLGVRATRGDK